MKVLILMGSPRIHGNTAELCKPFHIGMYSVRDTDNLASFQIAEAVAEAKQFAKELLKNLEE